MQSEIINFSSTDMMYNLLSPRVKYFLPSILGILMKANL